MFVINRPGDRGSADCRHSSSLPGVGEQPGRIWGWQLSCKGQCGQGRVTDDNGQPVQGVTVHETVPGGRCHQ